jgi:hypothetical protein
MPPEGFMAAASSSMATWKIAFESGVKLFRERQYEKAIDKFTEV